MNFHIALFGSQWFLLMENKFCKEYSLTEVLETFQVQTVLMNSPK